MLKNSTKRAITIILVVIVVFQVVLIASLWRHQIQKNDNYNQQLDNMQEQINPTGNK